MKLFDMWKQDYRLDKMTLRELWVAYFLHHSIQVYLILAVISGVWALQAAASAWPLIWATAAAIVIYPFAWYGLHRWVLHGKYLYKWKMTASAWKRIHFDHHRDPHDLKVLFGALYTTLPTIAIVTMPVGYLIGNMAGMWVAFSAGLLITCFYEFCHCIQHLNYNPKWPLLQKIKRLHLQHHFHDEQSNYGITNFIPDILLGTFKPKVKGRAQSETVFNLGYTGDEVRKFPWVARLTPDLDEEKAAIEGVDRRKPQKKKAA